MDTAITSLIVIAVLLLAVLTTSEHYFSSQDAILESWREMEERLGERARTDLSPVGAQTISSGSVVSVTLRNDGDTRLADFDQWDVILEYDGSDYACHVAWYPYGSGQNEWSVYDISPDAFDPDILNPGEEVVIWVSVSPSVAVSTTNRTTIATPNGIATSTVFTR